MMYSSRLITCDADYIHMSQFKNEITGKNCWFISVSDQTTIKTRPPYISMIIHFDHPNLQDYLYYLFSYHINRNFSKILDIVQEDIIIDNNLLISNFIEGGFAP